MKSESRDQLDKALSFLYEKRKIYYNHAELKRECFSDSSEIDVEVNYCEIKSRWLHSLWS